MDVVDFSFQHEYLIEPNLIHCQTIHYQFIDRERSYEYYSFLVFSRLCHPKIGYPRKKLRSDISVNLRLAQFYSKSKENRVLNGYEEQENDSSDEEQEDDNNMIDDELIAASSQSYTQKNKYSIEHISDDEY